MMLTFRKKKIKWMSFVIPNWITEDSKGECTCNMTIWKKVTGIVYEFQWPSYVLSLSCYFKIILIVWMSISKVIKMNYTSITIRYGITKPTTSWITCNSTIFIFTSLFCSLLDIKVPNVISRILLYIHCDVIGVVNVYQKIIPWVIWTAYDGKHVRKCNKYTDHNLII